MRSDKSQDVEFLRQQLAERDAAIAERERTIAEKEEQLNERERVIAVRDAELYAKTLQIENLKAQLAVLRRSRYGRSSEKLDHAQPIPDAGNSQDAHLGAGGGKGVVGT